MRTPPYQNEQDKLEQYVNSFATQSFRDQADRDYVAARLACRSELMPQFLWASHQAIEKYLKAILLYNRINATKVGHDLAKAMHLTKQLSFEIELSARSRSFFDHLAEYGEFRYIDVPYHVDGYVLIDLDLLIWELRRYCQVLNVFGKVLPPEEQTLVDKAKDQLSMSSTMPKHKFRLNGGILEKMLDEKRNPSRSALLWNNFVYGVRSRSTVRAKQHWHVQNPMLYLYPEMLDELLKYVFIPGRLVDGYRAHLVHIKANPEARP
ncbi:HEPN domain-containing protein [Rhodoferax sp.]|uniref:HEPN domain-containing protein n=1 Tax=Rhodoferax sp. TaxID=50421 RepID=UPI00374D59FE